MYGGFEELVKSGRAKLVTLEDSERLPPTGQSDDSKSHLDNWIDCMRRRDTRTNGNIHTGFWHSIGAAMATQAYRQGASCTGTGAARPSWIGRCPGRDTYAVHAVRWLSRRVVQNRKRSVVQRSARIVAVSNHHASQAALTGNIRALRRRRSVCGSVRLGTRLLVLPRIPPKVLRLSLRPSENHPTDHIRVSSLSRDFRELIWPRRGLLGVGLILI